MKEMVDNMKNAANQTKITIENRSLYSYSSHDTHIAYLMNMLGLYKG